MADITTEEQINPILEAFLDADTLEQKANVLSLHKEEITDSLVDSMAASLDTVIPDGDTDMRVYQLMQTVKTKNKYEGVGAGRLR